MSFGRHRHRTQETPKEEVVLKKTVIEPPVKETVKEEYQSVAVKDNSEAIEVIATHIKQTLEEENNESIALEKIEKVIKKPKKKREDQKEPNNVGIVGDTIEVRDFRAIVKKKGLQINNVLTEILNGWNMANYNL